MSEEQTSVIEEAVVTEAPAEETKVEEVVPETPVVIEPVPSEDPIVAAEKAVRKAKFDAGLQALLLEHNCKLIPIVVFTPGNNQFIIESQAL